MNNMTNPSTFGKHNTLITTIENTAMASWSGFVYQGLCALQHVLSLLKTDWNNAISKQLSLEAYEDFAIIDDTGKIDSLHQCKCIQSPHNYSSECEKMEDKHDYWKSKNMLSAETVPMYFHSNMLNTYTCGVNAYSFSSTKNTCSPVEIYNLIHDQVSELLNQKHFSGSSTTKSNKLILLVSKKVSFIHNQCIANPNNSFQIAVNSPIPIGEIASIIEKYIEEYNCNERYETCKFYLMLSLKNRLLTKPDADTSRINSFISDIEKLEDIELKNLINCLFPDLIITSTDTRIADMFASARGNCLFNVINGVVASMNANDFCWNGADGSLETPSTLGKDKDPEEFCPDIVKNPYTADLRRDYRWIVGDIDHRVDDIDEAAKPITQIYDKDHTDITQPKKIGLLDIKSKNDGNY